MHLHTRCLFGLHMTSLIATIKKEFFAYRNGIVADALRCNGDPHQYIMGCQLVDVISICARYASSVKLANELWSDRKHRECRMAATMLYPVSEMKKEIAMQWAMDVESNEIADVLCHRLLKHLPFAQEMAFDLIDNKDDIVKYVGWRLLLNLSIMGKVNNPEIVKERALQIKPVTTQRELSQVIDSLLEEL